MEIPFLSVVTPIYGCRSCLNDLYDRLLVSLGSITKDFEIIMVDDASPDNAWDTIKEISERDKRVKGIKLSRNFGQHFAITAGLDYARGYWIVVMDCDLQDRPEEIIKLYNKAVEGYDLVIGIRKDRKDSFFKKTYSKLFYRVFKFFTGASVDYRIGNFGIYSKKVIQSILKLNEYNRSFGLFAIWVGFKRIEIDVIHSKREKGKSTYTFGKMFSLAFDSIIAHSNKLLKISLKTGFVLSAGSILSGLFLLVRYLLYPISLIGYASLIVSIFFLAGLVVSSIGILGLYIEKIFNEVKKRPLYLIESTTNFSTGTSDDN